MGEGPREPVAFPHHQYIPLSGECERIAKSWSLRTGTGCAIGEGAFAPRSLEGINLEIKISVEGRNTSIADEHWFSLVIKTRATVMESRFSCKNGL
jgi:hypothetical protein